MTRPSAARKAASVQQEEQAQLDEELDEGGK